MAFIDRAGERLLGVFARAGAEFIANGVYTKHVIERFKKAPESRVVHTKQLSLEKPAYCQVSKHGKLEPLRPRARR